MSPWCPGTVAVGVPLAVTSRSTQPARLERFRTKTCGQQRSASDDRVARAEADLCWTHIGAVVGREHIRRVRAPEVVLAIQHVALPNRLAVVRQADPRVLRLRRSVVPFRGVGRAARGAHLDLARTGPAEGLLHLRAVGDQPLLSVSRRKEKLIEVEVVKWDAESLADRRIGGEGAVRGLASRELICRGVPGRAGGDAAHEGPAPTVKSVDGEHAVQPDASSQACVLILDIVSTPVQDPGIDAPLVAAVVIHPRARWECPAVGLDPC